MNLSLAQTESIYEATHRDLEKAELCTDDFDAALVAAVNSDGGEPDPKWKGMAKAAVGRSVPGGGTVLKEIPGMGRVYNWRGSLWTTPNGGRIKLRGFTHHVPVIRNVDGYADIVTLRNVLVDQDLMVQSCTDAEGNVGLFTYFDVLCYHAKGGNSVFTGCEHMHYSTSEDWSKRQLRAMAWLIQLCERKHGVPQTRWKLGAGDGVVRVQREGQGWHSEVSHFAGYNDRKDPWGDTPHQKVVERWEYVQSCIKYFEDHGHFKNA